MHWHTKIYSYVTSSFIHRKLLWLLFNFLCTMKCLSIAYILYIISTHMDRSCKIFQGQVFGQLYYYKNYTIVERDIRFFQSAFYICKRVLRDCFLFLTENAKDIPKFIMCDTLLNIHASKKRFNSLCIRIQQFF